MPPYFWRRQVLLTMNEIMAKDFHRVLLAFCIWEKFRDFIHSVKSYHKALVVCIVNEHPLFSISVIVRLIHINFKQTNSWSLKYLYIQKTRSITSVLLQFPLLCVCVCLCFNTEENARCNLEWMFLILLYTIVIINNILHRIWFVMCVKQLKKMKFIMHCILKPTCIL